MTKHKNPVLTVDGLVFEKNKVLLIKRNHGPFLGYWVLPGGHLEWGETTEYAVERELKEEIGLTVKVKRLIGIYSDPKRDPRGHTITAAYLVKRVLGEITLNNEASEYKFFSLNQLPRRMGFDHRLIVHDARREIGNS